jgi:type VI secretion system secreted protein VgrG
LIQQSASSAQRGAWRGSGFEATTQGWASIRAAKGLLISTTTRTGTYGSAQSTQMDAQEALAQLRGATDLGQRLSAAAASATAQPLSAFEADKSAPKLIDQIDPKTDAKHPTSVNGQEAKKAAAGSRTGTDPVEAFTTPVVVLDTPSTAVFATEAGMASFAGQDGSFAVQGDVHQTAAHTWASVSGKTSSWYVHEGGIKAFAANGPVSLRAHTDALQIWADKEVTVISVNDEIRISAQSKIELIAGQSSITLEGTNIEFKTPGAFSVKGGSHAFLGGGGQAAELPFLPQGVKTLPNWIEINHRDTDASAMAGQAYKIFFEGGVVIAGKLDAKGHARHDNVPANATRVEYEARKALKDKPWDALDDLAAAANSKLN